MESLDLDTCNIGDGSRTQILEYLSDKKLKDTNFTVIDVGGSMGSWSSSVADAYIDINHPIHNPNGCKLFQADLTNPYTWDEILSYVEKNGKFSFSICTHTLEDLTHPALTIQLLEKISDEGYIAVPSKYREMSNIEGMEYRGYIHHRWICSIRDNIFTLFPKINYLERSDIANKIGCIDNHVFDLNFLWKARVHYKIINDGYLGPSIDAVKLYYDNLLDDDMDKKYNIKIVNGELVNFT